MVISSTLFPIISLFIIGFYFIELFLGYKKGFLLQLIDLLSLVLSLFLAWLFAPILSDWFMLIPSNLFEINEYVKQFIMTILNNLSWFVIIFILVKLVLLLIRPLVKGIGKLPIIKSINGLLGSIFSLVQTTIYIFMFMIILQLPIFTNGQECINNTILLYVKDNVNEVINYINVSLINNEAMQNLSNYLNQLSENDRQDLIELLDKYNINKDSLESFR